jgi:alpha-L-fucosidase 2
MKYVNKVKKIYPIGKNGCFTGNVWNTNNQRTHSIQILAEDTLWTGTPGNYTNLNAPEVLSEVRKLVDDDKYAEATTEAVKLTGNPAEVRAIHYL